jgi:hypothetical protein
MISHSTCFRASRGPFATNGNVVIARTHRSIVRASPAAGSGSSSGGATKAAAAHAADAAAPAPGSQLQRILVPSALRSSLAAAAAAVALLAHPLAAVAAEAELVPFASDAQRYSLSVPAGWEKKDKAGADTLFLDPDRKSTNVGVTVSPVRVESIEQFGSLEAVGRRLMDTEAKKVGAGPTALLLCCSAAALLMCSALSSPLEL